MKKIMNIDDALYYQIFSLILSLIILYMMFSFKIEVEKATETVLIDKCNELYYKSQNWFISAINETFKNISVFNETTESIKLYNQTK